MVNTTNVTNQLNTLVRQNTLTFLITFALTHFCSGNVWCKTIRYIYCLICVGKRVVITWCNTKKKNQTLRFEIVVFWFTGPCNLIGGYRGFGLGLLPCFCKTFLPCTRLYDILTQISLWILTTVCTSNPVPKNIKTNWRWWKC